VLLLRWPLRACGCRRLLLLAAGVRWLTAARFVAAISEGPLMLRCGRCAACCCASVAEQPMRLILRVAAGSAPAAVVFRLERELRLALAPHGCCVLIWICQRLVLLPWLLPVQTCIKDGVERCIGWLDMQCKGSAIQQSVATCITARWSSGAARGVLGLTQLQTARSARRPQTPCATWRARRPRTATALHREVCPLKLMF